MSSDASSPQGGASLPLELQRTAVQVLNALALAAFLAAVSVVAMMAVEYFSSEERDWPGRYWYAVVPLLVASITLTLPSWRLAERDLPMDGGGAG